MKYFRNNRVKTLCNATEKLHKKREMTIGFDKGGVIVTLDKRIRGGVLKPIGVGYGET